MLSKPIVVKINSKLVGMTPDKIYEKCGALVQKSLGKHGEALSSGLFLSLNADLDKLELFDGKNIDSSDKPKGLA